MTTTTKTTAQLVPFTDAEKRTLLHLAHTHAVDQLYETQRTIAWLEGGSERLSPHKLLRGNSSTWVEREERNKRELQRNYETLSKYGALVDKLEAMFAVAEQADIEGFAAAMAEMWKAAKAADKKAAK